MSICSNLAVIAAICGNFWMESQVNPGAWERWTVGQPGYGLGQWTDNPPDVMRRTALFNWLSANGYPNDSGEGQLAFLVAENLWIPNLIEPSFYNTLTEYFQSTSSNVAALTREFMYHWEGINNGTENTRIDYAWEYYDKFLNDDGTRYPWTARNSQISETEALHNTMHIKDFFWGSQPEPPEPGELTDAELLALFRSIIRRKKKGGYHIVL